MAIVSGIWVFNDTITTIASKPSSNKTEKIYSVNYTTTNSNGTVIESNGFYIINDQYKFSLSNNGSLSLYIYSKTSSSSFTVGWQAESYKTVDFGVSAQTVDDSFYEWLTSNATRKYSLPTFDLSTLNLTGTHTITVKAKGSGYISSPPSEAIEYTA